MCPPLDLQPAFLLNIAGLRKVDTIWDALERVKKAAQNPPVEIDAQRATAVASIEEGCKRLESLKILQQNQPPPVLDTSSKVQRLQALVAQLQSQLVQVAGPQWTFQFQVAASCVEEMQL